MAELAINPLYTWVIQVDRGGSVPNANAEDERW